MRGLCKMRKPEDLTSFRFSGISRPLSIWTMTNLPDFGWPGTFFSNFLGLFYLRWLCVAQLPQFLQSCQGGCHQKTSDCQKLEAHPKCGQKYSEFAVWTSLRVCWKSQLFERWLLFHSQWQSKAKVHFAWGNNQLLHRDEIPRQVPRCFHRYTWMLQRGR